MSLTEKIPNCIFIPHSKLYAFAWISNSRPPADIPRGSLQVKTLSSGARATVRITRNLLRKVPS
jgi:hypothetical protein